MKERTIFKSYLFWTAKEEEEQKQAIKEYLIEDAEHFGGEVDLSEERIEQRFFDDLDFFYDDARLNLSHKLPNNIIAFGSLGRWNGRFNAGKIMGNNLNEILNSFECDDISVTYDRYNVHSELCHHDGTNYMTFRMIKDGVDSDWLLNKQVYGGGLSKNDISRYTTSLVPYIKKIYG